MKTTKCPRCGTYNYECLRCAELSDDEVAALVNAIDGDGGGDICWDSDGTITMGARTLAQLLMKCQNPSLA